MVLDSSAVVAVLLAEPDADTLMNAIAADPVRLLGAVTLLEAALVLTSRRGEAGSRALDGFVRDVVTEVVPFTPEQARLARSAWERFGKRRHTAALNIGDCCSYALARATGDPLLYKGDDFARTDIPSALDRE